MTTIRPEFLAAKIQAARFGEPEAGAFTQQLAGTPRLAEALWFLEWAFRQPGGGPRFVDKLIELSPDQFQTRAMRDAGPPQAAGRYSLAQCLAVWKADEKRIDRFESVYDEGEPGDSDSLSYRDFLGFFVGAETRIEQAKLQDRRGAELRSALARFNFEFLKKNVTDAARNYLPRLLADWCEEKSMSCADPWYCPDLLQTIFNFMDRHAADAGCELAETEVTKIVFRELEFARSQCVGPAWRGW
ncbi:MAG: hypothetical protein MUF81_17810 [Verrucomicrobia bacterium]|nr:hypothetical protein [Verrucomicrobiota bacterium]